MFVLKVIGLLLDFPEKELSPWGPNPGIPPARGMLQKLGLEKG